MTAPTEMPPADQRAHFQQDRLRSFFVSLASGPLPFDVTSKTVRPPRPGPTALPRVLADRPAVGSIWQSPATTLPLGIKRPRKPKNFHNRNFSPGRLTPSLRQWRVRWHLRWRPAHHRSPTAIAKNKPRMSEVRATVRHTREGKPAMSTPVNLTGRVVAEPELRFSAKGQPVAKFAVVTSRRVRDNQTGEWSDADTSFWDCVAFGQLAEHAAESQEKGTAVLVVGRAVQRNWETKEGEKRRSEEVTVDEVAPSLRWATCKVLKAERSRPTGNSGGDADPWASDSTGGYSSEPPF
jgi:single-strand DNA-binding protein